MVPASLEHIGYATSEKQSITQPQSARRAGGVFLGMKKSHGLLLTSAEAAHSGAIISEVALSAHMNIVYLQTVDQATKGQ